MNKENKKVAEQLRTLAESIEQDPKSICEISTERFTGEPYDELFISLKLIKLYKERE